MGALLFGLLFGTILIGIPLAFGILLTGTLFITITDIRPLVVVAQRAVMGMDSFPLLAIPLFIFMGYLMEQAGISRKLIDWVNVFFGNMKGSLGAVTIISCAIFASLTGSGPATIAAIGSIMLPAMINEGGYPPKTAAGLTAASGVLGPIIPPSITMIVYGTTMGVSVPKMFAGGIVPGLIMAALLLVVNFINAGKWNPITIKKKYSMSEYIDVTIRALPVLILPIIILGGIYGGIFTPTEAATIGVVYCLVLSFFYKKLTFSFLKDAMLDTVLTAATIGFLIGASSIFGWILAYTRIPAQLTELALPILTNQYVYLTVLTVILLIAGTLMETIPCVIVLGPILVPIGIALGLNPLHLGVVFCVNLVIGFITPPFGINLFTTVSISKLSFDDVVKGVLPFLAVEIITLFIITFIPQIVLWIPNLIYN